MKIIVVLSVLALFILSSCVLGSRSLCYKVYGRNGCWYFEDAKSVVQKRAANNASFKAEVFGFGYDAWYLQLDNLNKKYGQNRRTSPFIVEGCPGSGLERVVGGRDDLMAELARLPKANDTAQESRDI